jgi:hypothetical protein
MRAQAAGTMASEARRLEPVQRGYTAILGRRRARLSSTVASRTGGKTRCTAHRWPPQCVTTMVSVACVEEPSDFTRTSAQTAPSQHSAKSCGVNLPPGGGEYDAHSHENRRIGPSRERSAVQPLRHAHKHAGITHRQGPTTTSTHTDTTDTHGHHAHTRTYRTHAHNTRTRAHTHARTHARAHTRTRAHTHARTHARAHTRTHARAHAHEHAR